MHACQHPVCLTVHYISQIVCTCGHTWVLVATGEKLASLSFDIPDIGDDSGELSSDDSGELSEDLNEEEDGEEDGEEGEEGEDGGESETDVMSQRSNPDPVSEAIKLVRPQPVAALVSHPLELRYVLQELRP